MTNIPNTLDKYLHSIDEFTESSGSFGLGLKNNKRKESALIHSSTKKSRKGKNKDDDKAHTRSDWDQNWIKEYPWLDRRLDINGVPEIYCVWCTTYNQHSTGVFVIGTKRFKKDYLEKHIVTKEHKKAMENHTGRQSNQLDLMSGFTTQAGVDKLDIIAKMRCVYLCAKKHLAIEAFPDLVELI